jgi:hypothetical protein
VLVLTCCVNADWIPGLGTPLSVDPLGTDRLLGFCPLASRHDQSTVGRLTELGLACVDLDGSVSGHPGMALWIRWTSVASLRLVGELAQHENSYRFCYLSGPQASSSCWPSGPSGRSVNSPAPERGNLQHQGDPSTFLTPLAAQQNVRSISRYTQGPQQVGQVRVPGRYRHGQQAVEIVLGAVRSDAEQVLDVAHLGGYRGFVRDLGDER